MDRKTWGIILLFGFILGAILVVFEFVFKIINLNYIINYYGKNSSNLMGEKEIFQIKRA